MAVSLFFLASQYGVYGQYVAVSSRVWRSLWYAGTIVTLEEPLENKAYQARIAGGGGVWRGGSWMNG